MEELKAVLKDFCNDIKNTFPEKKETVEKYNIEELIPYCKEYFTQRTLEIVYKNEKIFMNEPTFFLPNIDFNELWASNISVETKETIWKYLQLILFSYVSLDEYSFDDTVKFFEQLDKDDFKEKIEDIMKNLKTDENFDISSIPNADKINSTFDNLFDTKIGNIAQEIAEETSKKMNIDPSGNLMENMFKDPTALMSLVKTVGDSLDKKMKAGDINQEELLKESSSLLGNLNMNNDIQKLFSSLGMGDLASMASNAASLSKGAGAAGGEAPQKNKKQKYDTNKMKQKLNKMSTKERLQRKLELKKKKEEEEKDNE
jgi:hypothetical protein